MLKKFCRKSGCKTLTDSNYCESHQSESHQRYDRNRLSAAKRGYDYKWQKARLKHLRDHPLCVSCLSKGFTKEAKHVDHIVPHQGDMNLFWDKNNWQSLCASCHSIKTVKEDGGFGR